LNEQLMNAGLALAGKGAPLQQANLNYQMQQDAYNQAQNAGNWRTGLDLLDRFGVMDWGKNQVTGWLDSFLG